MNGFNIYKRKDGRYEGRITEERQQMASGRINASLKELNKQCKRIPEFLIPYLEKFQGEPNEPFHCLGIFLTISGILLTL